MKRRGIVTTPQLEEIQGGIKGGPVIKPETFRQYLVYWDEIVIVNLLNPMIGSFGVEELPKENHDAKIAFDAGHLKIANHNVRDKKTYHSREIAEDFRVGQQKIAFENTQIYDGYWTIGQSIKSLQLPKSRSVKKNVITTKLHQALPVPGNGVSAEEIIKFKEKRSVELEAFRDSYDALYDKIVNSGDQKLALQKAIERLNNFLSEIRKVMVEGNLNPTQMTMETLWKIGTDTMIKYGAASVIFSDFGFVPIMVGSINAAISLNKVFENEPELLSAQTLDFAYLNYIETELNKK